MKILLGIMATAALATTPTLAVAKGRIKGAVVGAAAGHMVGHGHAVAGAAVGSMVGHHHAKKMAGH